MSRLEELIQELCPNGVEYKKIKEVYKRIKGTPITAGKMKEIENPDGDIRVFAGGKTVINAFEEDIPNANITRVPAVLVQSRGVIDAVYYDKPFTFKNELWAYTTENPIAVKFLYYVLKNNIQQFRDAAAGMGALPQIALPTTEEFVIPVPPIEVQGEIVRILDNFTELTAELTARKKQYEYYRDILFNVSDCEVKPIFEIAQTNIGLATSVTKHKRESGVPLIHNSDIQQNAIVLKNIEYISEEFAEKNRKKILRIGDIITVHTGDVGTSAVIDDKFDGAIGFTTITTRINDSSEILPQYLCHYLNSHRCKADIATMTISDRSNLNQSSFEKLMIPIPSIEKQQQIIDTLNRFDAICSDISSGLPAEIEARQKQYEYYRDKLLNFKEMSV